MAKHKVEPEASVPTTEAELRKFFGDLFEKLATGVNVDITPEMEATILRVLNDPDLIGILPEVMMVIYHLFVMKELNSSLMLANSDLFQINFNTKSLETYVDRNQRAFDSHSLKQQTLKIKETLTDRLVFI